MEAIEKQRIYTVLDRVASFNSKDIGQRLAAIETEWLSLFKPVNFDWHSPKGHEHQAQASFTKLCIAMEEHLGQQVEWISTYKFFMLLDHIKNKKNTK